MPVWMTELKRSGSFLLSLTNENKNLIPKLFTVTPTLPTIQFVLEHICYVFSLYLSLFDFSCSVLTSVFFPIPKTS